MLTVSNFRNEERREIKESPSQVPLWPSDIIFCNIVCYGI